ncbi:MAG: hypothetical protein IPI22_08465 [Bacteroidetes bacterium]|nr:hypothetical protein [Bacteroidota bacterium]
MIQDVSTMSLINCFSLDPLNWNGQIGVKTLPSATVDGYPKSGWIAATASDGNRVAGRVLYKYRSRYCKFTYINVNYI